MNAPASKPDLKRPLAITVSGLSAKGTRRSSRYRCCLQRRQRAHRTGVGALSCDVADTSMSTSSDVKWARLAQKCIAGTESMVQRPWQNAIATST
jgi:hypothetical protein